MPQIRPTGLVCSVCSLLAILLLPSPGAAQVSCGPLPAPTGNVIDVTPAQAANLRSIVAAANTGDTIRLADGTYVLPQALVFRTPGVTIRSASGNRDSVILDGQYQRRLGDLAHGIERHDRGYDFEARLLPHRTCDALCRLDHWRAASQLAHRRRRRAVRESEQRRQSVCG